MQQIVCGQQRDETPRLSTAQPTEQLDGHHHDNTHSAAAEAFNASSNADFEQENSAAIRPAPPAHASTRRNVSSPAS